MFDDLGAQTLKNIAETMQAWRIRIGGEPAPEPVKNPAAPHRAIVPPDKPSIAVLPFQNMSGDPEQEYFADGMVEDIITALSRFKSLFVIARNSTFTYKGKNVDIKRVGRELGVRYVLEGSVARRGDRVRITGQLIEAATGAHIWADRFDGALEDVFGLQDQVATSVVGLIAPGLNRPRSNGPGASRPESSTATISICAARRRCITAPRCTRRSISSRRRWNGSRNSRGPRHGGLELDDRQAIYGKPLDREHGRGAPACAAGGATGQGRPFRARDAGHVLTYLGHEYERGAAMVEQAVALNPNLAVAWYSRGWVSLMRGEAERAVESFERWSGKARWIGCN